MSELLESINTERLPNHVAIIMDGNGRWAKSKGKLRIFGHQSGIKAVRETIKAAAGLKIKYLTLYTFSTENWNRPQREINALMELMVNTIAKETKTLIENNIRLNTIGDIAALPLSCQKSLAASIEKTSGNTGMTLVLALSYSARWEIINAVKQIAKETASGTLKEQDINESLFSKYLTTHAIPDPELLIRTSGEHRISNFLLWQISYAELYFTPVLWPDFNREHFYEAILEYQGRERRFGKTSEQLSH
jgi:undecaprenyl diphosphate synthase